MAYMYFMYDYTTPTRSSSVLAPVVGTREEANKLYKQLRACPQVTRLEGFYLTVTVRFRIGGPEYTYFSHCRYKNGRTIMVPTPDGQKEATVVRSGLQRKSELLEAAPNVPIARYRVIPE